MAFRTGQADAVQEYERTLADRQYSHPLEPLRLPGFFK